MNEFDNTTNIVYTQNLLLNTTLTEKYPYEHLNAESNIHNNVMYISNEDVFAEMLGDTVTVDFCIRNADTKKLTAIYVTLYELDRNKTEHEYETKTVLLPPLTSNGSSDIMVSRLEYVIPQNNDTITDKITALYRPRNFKVKFTNNNFRSNMNLHLQ